MSGKLMGSSRLGSASIEEKLPLRLQGDLDIGLVGDVLFRGADGTDLSDDVIAATRKTAWEPVGEAALIVANLESPITNSAHPAERKPHLHKMPRRALALFDERFVLSLANNHIMDFGAEGLRDTMAALDDAGIAYAGAGPTLERASEPRLVKVADITVAVICAADPRFSPATATSPGTCPARSDLLVGSVRAVAGSAQVTVVSLHMGFEHVSVPSTAQIRLAEACLQAGAQIVHFHHSHCSSGASTDGRGVVLFGTGNYVFTKTPQVTIPSSRRSAAWRVRIDRVTRRVLAVAATPVVLDSAGLPRPLEGAQAMRERARLQECSDRVLSGVSRQWLRLCDVLSPGFMRACRYNYGSLLRSRGPRYVVKSIAGGIRAQFGRQRP
jgi:poly-gamma-glutamate synthesis protein (capsule biosynthesis protein)